MVSRQLEQDDAIVLTPVRSTWSILILKTFCAQAQRRARRDAAATAAPVEVSSRSHFSEVLGEVLGEVLQEIARILSRAAARNLTGIMIGNRVRQRLQL
jgi:hypothetical protein